MENNEVRIINFHGIGTPSRKLENGEGPYWIEEEKYLQILDLIEPVKHRVQITFDDGNASDLEIGVPGLEKRGLKATFFPLAGRVDKQGSLSSEGLRELLRARHKVGSHGHGHMSWKELDERSERTELVDARALLEDYIGQSISEAAIPFGLYGRNTLRQLKAHGYKRVYSSDGGGFQGSPYPVPRWSVREDTSLEDVSAFLSGRESVLRRLRRGIAKAKKQII
ncbi:peptidoglycan/xylan/chitin deacetylase (PgdA/CDA1 family) [Labrenzia sp. EL_13]|nr:peptidoglycan/xylan/chitin deacetylase (PgdA/CDA1 family) [Labrenzia sp. EL_13]